ncbi:MAG TPA: glycosyltransferase [Bacteroidia bacterium]|nr:glycosyltransferase [Bacteroidia bacterium]
MISVVLILSGIFYALIILLSYYGWKRTKTFFVDGIDLKTKVSVIIPARNEEMNILQCLKSLAQQSFPKNLFEIIVVDDKSEDGTSDVVKNWIDNHPVNTKIIFPENGTGKKNALNEGIKIATGELIVTTDADCTMGKDWLSTIVSYYEKSSPDLLAGMVALKEENNFLTSFQSLELTGLTAIGAAGIYFRQPLLCNGANLAYRKNIFESVGGYNLSKESASGDDTMLMFRIAKQKPGSVHFLKSDEATVYTNTASSLQDLFRQRRRWGSKVLGQKNYLSILIALAAFLFHVSLVGALILSAAHIVSWEIFLALIVIKIIPEIILLSDALSFSGWTKSLPTIFLSQIIYPFYLVAAVLLSQTGSYNWKGRIVK